MSIYKTCSPEKWLWYFTNQWEMWSTSSFPGDALACAEHFPSVEGPWPGWGRCWKWREVAKGITKKENGTGKSPGMHPVAIAPSDSWYLCYMVYESSVKNEVLWLMYFFQPNDFHAIWNSNTVLLLQLWKRVVFFFFLECGMVKSRINSQLMKDWVCSLYM